MDEKQKGISRREFLKDAGLVVGGAAVGAAITYPLVPKEVVKEVIKEVEVAKYKCPYCGVTLDTFDALKAHITAQHPVEAIPEEVPKYVCPTCSAEFDSFSALKAHFAAEHPPEVGVVEPAFEPEETFKESVIVPLNVDVKHGKIVRTRPVHYSEDFPNVKPWRIEARGKTWIAPNQSCPTALWTSYKKRVYSPYRVVYPLKRVGWEPGGEEVNPQNRGKSKFKRISWDEATTIIASELTRVAEKYGPEAICDLYQNAHGERRNVSGGHKTIGAFLNYYLFSKYGAGQTMCHNTHSSQSGDYIGGIFFSGDWGSGQKVHQDVCEHTELILGWGCDPTVHHFCDEIKGLMTTSLIEHFRTLGIKSVYISPDLNRTAQFFADKWIPVLPITDGALMLAIAYTWITEDTYDKEYIATHSVGFDKFKAYVMGDEDGIPKTAEWASPLCAVPVWTIKALARQFASKVTSIMYGRSGGGCCRAPYSSETTRLREYLLGMQGWGKPGVHDIRGCHKLPHAVNRPIPGAASDSVLMLGALRKDLGISVSLTDRKRQIVSRGLFYKCMLNPPVYWTYSKDPFYMRRYPLEGFSEVHMIWSSAASYTGGLMCGFANLEAYRSPKLECVVQDVMWLEDGLLYSDIILPIASQYESWDIDSNEESDSFSSLWLMPPAVEPLGETKTDYEAVLEVAKKLDFYDEIYMGMSIEDRLKYAWETSGQRDLVSWEELKEKSYFPREVNPDWAKIPPHYCEFYKDPKANPLPTPTGLLEYESTELLENFPDDKERPPVAHYVRGGPAAEGWTHDESLDSERAKKYPLLVTANVKSWGEHSMHADNPWTREIQKIIGWDGYAYSPIWIHPVDAALRGIENGDIVMMYNERGTVLGCAYVTEKVIPGSLEMDQGGGYDNIADRINRGGNPNAITPYEPCSKYAHGQTFYGWLAEIEKVTGNQMDEWRKNYPDAFTRDYDPRYGPLFTGWVEGGM